MKIETALLSVYNKEGVVELGQRLTEMGIRILLQKLADGWKTLQNLTIRGHG